MKKEEENRGLFTFSMSINYKNIFRKGANTFVIQGVSILLTLLLNWYLATTLKADLYGIFTYVFSWVFFFGSLSTLGMEGVLLRETAKYHGNNQAGAIRGILQFAKRLNLIATLFIVLVFIIVIQYIIPRLSAFENPMIPSALLIAIFALPFFSQILLRQTVCISLKKIEYGFLPDKVIRPLIFLCLLFIANQWFGNYSLYRAVMLNLVSFVFTFFVATYFLKKTFSTKDNPEHTDKKNWIKLGTTFFFLYLIGSINARADILMLGMFGFTEKVGIYNIAVRFAQMLILPFILSNNIIAPYVAQLFEHKKSELLILIKRVIRIVFLLGTIGFILYFFFGKWILSFFGVEFIEGYHVLLLLSCGQLVNLFLGPVGIILTMSQYENLALKGMVGSAVINIVLNMVLIPIYGMHGAAIATFAGMVYWNIILFILVYKKLGLNPSVI